jgi:hypothetical protein
MLETVVGNAAMSLPSAPAYVPLDGAVRELRHSPTLAGLTWLPDRFEEAVKLALADGVPMRGKPEPDMRSSLPRVSSLSRRIDVQRGDHLELSLTFANVTITRSNGRRETFEFVEVDREALKRKLEEIARDNGLVEFAEEEKPGAPASPGRPALKEAKDLLYREWNARGDRRTAKQWRDWLGEQRLPPGKLPDKKTIAGWRREWRKEAGSR